MKTWKKVVLWVFAIVVLALAAALFVRVVGIHAARMRNVNRDSDIAYEFAVIRAYLSGYHEEHGHYPERLGDSVEYNGEDYQLQHRDAIVYTSGNDLSSFDLTWTTSDGQTIHENGPSGNGTDTIHALVFSECQSSPSRASNDGLRPGETIWVCNAQHIVKTEDTEVRILADGTATLPIIGAVRLAGLTISEAERTVQDAYRVSGVYTHLQVRILRE